MSNHRDTRHSHSTVQTFKFPINRWLAPFPALSLGQPTTYLIIQNCTSFFYLLLPLGVLFIKTFNKPLPLPVHSPGHYVTLRARHGVYSPYYAHERYPIKSAALSPVKNIIVVAAAAPSRPLLQSRSENYALSTNKLFTLTSSEEMDLDLLRIFHFLPPKWYVQVASLEIIPPLWSGSRSACPQAYCAAAGHSPPFICLPSPTNPPRRHEMDFLYVSDAIRSHCSKTSRLKSLCWILLISPEGFFSISFIGRPRSTFMFGCRWMCGNLGESNTN